MSSGETIGDQGTSGSPEESGTEAETWEPVDWMQGGYQMPRGVRGHRESSCVNTYVLDIPEPEFAYAKKDWRFYTSLGGDFYVLDMYAMDEAWDENTQYRYQLYWLDGDTGESRVLTPFWEEQGMNEWVWQVDAVSDHQLAFLSGGAKWLESSEVKLMLWDLESGETRIWDMTRAYPEDRSHIWMDAQGYAYVSVAGNAPALYVLGEKDTPGEMELLRTIEVENFGDLYCRMPDGTPLVYMDGKLVYVDMDAGGVKELASVENYSADEGCIDERGLLYQIWNMQNNTQINVWNPATGDYDIMVIHKEYRVSCHLSLIHISEPKRSS
ncbi:MAG: hypothetical protein K2L18_09025, partial [Acetatifactor sp.]|nr:hypothetical protein [Acetatifactor sp.]